MKIREYMEREGLTARQLADRCGIDRASVFRAIQGCAGRKVALKIVEGTGGAVGLADALGLDQFDAA